jgi:hypothetical protein
MKSNHWLFCGLVAMTAASAWSQDGARSGGAPAAAEAYAKDVVLDPPAQATVKNDAVRVRGLPALAGDVLANLSRGGTVTVFEQFTLAKPKTNEPASWSRVALPTNVAVWVSADFVNTNTMTASSRLNVRAGPSEAYNVVARLDKGTPVAEVRRAGGWIQIAPPTNACGFVASEFLVLQTPASPPPAPEPVAPPPVVASAPEPAPAPAPPVQPAPAEATNTTPPVVAVAPEPVATPAPPVEPAPAEVTNATPPVAAAAAIVAPEPVAAAPTNTIAPPAPPAPTESVAEMKPRVVTREGVVHRALNIQAPTDYELIDTRSGALTEYLQSGDKNFKAYLGSRVTVTGPEMLDGRWPKTPILQVQTVDLLP